MNSVGSTGGWDRVLTTRVVLFKFKCSKSCPPCLDGSVYICTVPVS